MSIQTIPNPAIGKLYIVQLELESSFQQQPLSLKLVYQPDRQIILFESLPEILATFSRAESLEALADMFMEIIFDTVLPFWLRLYFSITTENGQHSVIVEEAQPGYVPTAGLRYGLPESL